GRVIRLNVVPSSRTAKPGESYSLRVEAAFADGAVEDITPYCSFEGRDRSVADVDSQGRVQAASPGDTALVVRFRAQPILATVLVPPESAAPVAAVTENNFIDRHVFDKLRRLGIPATELCDDATFLRRISLDIAGALPPPEEIRDFLADTATDKRTKKIDE